MVMLEDLKTYSLSVTAQDIKDYTGNLMQENIAADSIPYLNDNPPPPDMNIVTGRHLTDINRAQLELKAAEIGAKSLKWIYGADAALMGLQLKDGIPKEKVAARQKDMMFDSNPIICYANVQRNLADNAKDELNEAKIAAEGLGLDAQCVYLLDQFTDKSIQRSLNPKRIEEMIAVYGSEEAKKKAALISKNIVANTEEYDCGKHEAPLRKAKYENFISNCKKDIDGKPNMANREMGRALTTILKDYDADQKLIFSAINKYHLKQDAGIGIKNPLDKEKVKAAFDRVSERGNAVLVKTIMDAQLFTERQMHKDFSFDRVYTIADTRGAVNTLSPQWAQFKQEDRAPSMLMDAKAQKQLQSQSRQAHELPRPKRERQHSPERDITR